MLGPFRIRNLRRPASPSNSLPPGISSKLSSYDAVVCLTGREYGNNAARYPETRLKYVDEDDGEIVTVGTSMELAERLQEPIPRFDKTLGFSHSQHPIVSNHNPNLLLRPITPDMHVFEVDNQGQSIQIWEEIEQRTQQYHMVNRDAPEIRQVTTRNLDTRLPSNLVYYDAMLPKKDRNNGRTDDDMSGQVDLSDDASRFQEMYNRRWVSSQNQNTLDAKQPEDARQLHFRASNPPQIAQDSIRGEKASSARCQCSVFSLTDDDTLAKDKKPLIAPIHEGNLTIEGRRQAVEAGIQLRVRTNPIRHPKSARKLDFSASDKNRWASYGSSKPFDIERPKSQGYMTSEALCEPKTKFPQFSQLELFEAEFAKISKQTNNIKNDEGKFSTDQLLTQSPRPKSISTPNIEHKKASPESNARQLLINTVKSLVDGLESLMSGLHDECMKAVAKRDLSTLPSSAKTSEASEQVLQFMLGEADFRILDATKTCQEAVEYGRSVSDESRKVNVQRLQVALQSLERAMAALSTLALKLSSFSNRFRGDDIAHGLPASSTKQSTTHDRPEWLSTNISRVEPNHHNHHISPSASRWSEQVIGSGRSGPDPEIPRGPNSKTTQNHSNPNSIRQELPSNNDANNHETDNITPPRVEPSRARIPSVRFADPPAIVAKRHIRPIVTSCDKDYKNESIISYRHIPRRAKYESLSIQRGRQSLQRSPSIVVEKSRNQYTDQSMSSGMYSLHKQRSMPTLQHQYKSRLRSRSPVATGNPQDYILQHSLTSPSGKGAPKSTIYSPYDDKVLQIEGSFTKLPGNVSANATAPVTQGSAFSAINVENPGTSKISENMKTEDPSSQTSRWQSHYPTLNEGIMANHDGNRSLYDFSGVYSPHTEHPTVEHPALKHSFSVDALPKANTVVGLQSSLSKHRNLEHSRATTKSLYKDNLPTDHANVSPESTKSFTLALTSNNAGSSTAATRFPTLEQFESKSHPNIPRFPPLPTMEPLVPQRFSSSKFDRKDSLSQRSNQPRVESDDSKFPTHILRTQTQSGISGKFEESSGEFFTRMTGLGSSSKISKVPSSPSPIPSSIAADARLITPFDPLAETAAIHRYQQADGIRRSKTVASSSHWWTGGRRRPYSECFSGNGRLEWDSFIAGDHRDRLPLSHEEGLPSSNRPQGLPRALTSAARLSRYTAQMDEASIPTHHDPSTVSAVQSCVEQLQNLGFGGVKDGGVKRLVVYAQAADGDLGDAIDMIDEERKAYGNSERSW